jgi:NifU-like protein involved in Fe-S cluster formation
VSTDPYSVRVRELFSAPVHAGVLDSPLCIAVEDQGVQISLYAEIAAGEVQALRFQAWGCPHVIATAEAFCAGYEGRPIADLLEFSASDFMQSLSVPVEKTGRILVIEDAVRSLGSTVRDASTPDD